MSIAVIEKTFQVLEALARMGEPVPLMRLASESDLPKPTAYRILQSLASLGYVAQDAAGHYFSTDRLVGLAARDPHHSSKELARPLMNRLHTKFNETVNLGVLEGGKVVYAWVMETAQSLRWVVRPGRSDAFHCTALGRAIVSFLPPERQEHLLKKVRTESGGAATATVKKLRKILEETRRRNWALEEEEAASGVACFAFPLVFWEAPDAAISISIPISRLTPKLRADVVEEFEAILSTKIHAAGTEII